MEWFMKYLEWFMKVLAVPIGAGLIFCKSFPSWFRRRSCRFTAKRPLTDDMDAAGIIIAALWNRLRQTHPLRRVR